MRRLIRFALTAGLALGLAGPATAALMNWEGTGFLELGDFPTAAFAGGGIATVNGSGGGLPAHLDTLNMIPSRGGIFVDLFTLFVTDPETSGNSIASIEFEDVRPGTGTLGPISGVVTTTPTATALSQNIIPVRGLVRICLFTNSCSQFLPLDLTQPDPTHTTRTVKGVGIGGLLLIVQGGGGIRISIEAAPWTAHTATVTDHVETTGMAGCPPVCLTKFTPVPLSAFAHGPASLVSSTAAISGVLQYVTPAQVRTNLALGSNVKVSAGIQTLMHFIPEPGLLLLLGSGVVGLSVLGHRRLRR